MKTVLTLIVVVSGVLQANASVQLFYTASHDGYGLVYQNRAFWPTEGNRRDVADGHYLVNSFPDGFHATAHADIGEIVYIWLRFNNEPNSRTINCVDIDASDGNPLAAWYILDDTIGSGARRWDGVYTLPHGPEFQVAHKILEAESAYGLKNLNANNSGWQYHGGSVRTYLLGAMQFSFSGEYTLSLGTGGISYAGGYPPPTTEFGSVAIPEPSALFLVLTTLLLPRSEFALRRVS